MDETLRMAKRHDFAEADHKGFGSSLNYRKVFRSADEANAEAKRMTNHALSHPVGIELAKQEDVANGELPYGYQLPPSDSVAKESIVTGGRGSYSGSITFFCDPYGADVWTVCTTEYKCRVVVQGDWSDPAATAAGKAATSKHSKKPAATTSAAPKPSASKASASRTAISKPPAKKKPRVGIVSVPGMSQKEVAALNKQARASAAAMRRADDSDEDDYSGLRGRSQAFWERELL
jgi:hypothetical protein